MDSHDKELMQLFLRFLQILQRNHPFPPELERLSSSISPTMFHSPNQRLSSLIIYYILDIIDSARRSSLVPNPMGCKSFGGFNQGVIKFLTEISKENPRIKITGLRISTLATPYGTQFIQFMSQLISQTVKMKLHDKGVLNNPALTHLDNGSAIQVWKDKEDRFMFEYAKHKRTTSVDKTEEINMYSESLEKLRDVRARLTQKWEELVSRAPEEYKEKLGTTDPASTSVLKDWIVRLQESYLSRLAQYKDLKEGNESIVRALQIVNAWKNPPVLDRHTLLTPHNREFIQKVAANCQIGPIDHNGHLCLDGYLKAVGKIVEKKVELVTNTSFVGQPETETELKNGISELTSLLPELNAFKLKILRSIEKLKSSCGECLKLFEDEMAANGHRTEEYPNVALDALFKDDSLSPEHFSIHSPGTSWIQELEGMRERIAEQHHPSGCLTPTSSRAGNKKQNDTGVSTSLAKSVIWKQACASNSRCGESTIGEMMPLSTSSPVPVPFHEEAHQPTMDATSSLEMRHSFFSEDLEPWDVSDPDIFKSALPKPPKISGVVSKSSSAQPETGETPPSMHSEPFLRPPRRSLQALINRYSALRKNMAD